MAELQMQPAAAIDWSSIMRENYALACGIIKRRMPRCLRARYDPEDFVGDAIVELMTNRARFVEYGPDLLILIAKHRMIDAARSPRSRLMPLGEDLIDRQPSVALENDAAVLREVMLGRAGDPGDRVVVDLRCRGTHCPKLPSSLAGAYERFKGFSRISLKPMSRSEEARRVRPHARAVKPAAALAIISSSSVGMTRTLTDRWSVEIKRALMHFGLRPGRSPETPSPRRCGGGSRERSHRSRRRTD